MKHSLDLYDYEIFNKLYQDPFITYAKLSRSIDLTPGTIKERILSMKKLNFINDDGVIVDEILGKRKITEVEIRYHPTSIGLMKQHLVFHNIPSENSYNSLINFCNEHPYTIFRADVYGNGKSLYVQFDIPKEILDIMTTTYKQIANELQITDLIQLNEDYYIGGQPDFSNWNYFSRKWKNKLPIKELYKQSSKEETIEIPEREVYKLSNLDAILLRELSINGKATVTELAKIYNKNKSTISRRISRLMDKVVSHGRLNFNRDVFSLNCYHIVSGKFIDGKTKSQFENFMSSKELPIQIRISFNGSNYNLYSVGSSINSTDLISQLWCISDPETFISYEMDSRNFASYYFYHKNYDAKSGWNTSRDYVKHLPLESLSN